MGFLKKLFSSFSGGGREADESYIHREYVRCARCGESLAVRVDLRNELTAQYDGAEDAEGAYICRKGIVGSGRTRCFQQIEVELTFDANRQLLSRSVTGGEFITRDEFEAADAPAAKP